MCLCGVAKNRIVTCGKCVYWFEKGYEQIGAVDSCKNTYFHVFYLNVKLLYKLFLTITRQNKFLLAWIDSSCAFNYRRCFGKTLIPFHFDEEHTLSFVQITM